MLPRSTVSLAWGLRTQPGISRGINIACTASNRRGRARQTFQSASGLRFADALPRTQARRRCAEFLCEAIKALCSFAGGCESEKTFRQKNLRSSYSNYTPTDCRPERSEGPRWYFVYPCRFELFGPNSICVHRRNAPIQHFPTTHSRVPWSQGSSGRQSLGGAIVY